MACSDGFPHRVTQSSSDVESITLVSESISVCDSLCGSIFSVSHLYEPPCFPQHKETFSFFLFLLHIHCLDRIAPLIDLTLKFPVKGFVCVVSLSRKHQLMTISPSHSWMVLSGPFRMVCFQWSATFLFFLSCEILKPQPQNKKINWVSTPAAVS